MEQQAIRHRLATAADVRLYFNWANDPVTRQQSFSSAPVPWETHEAWFARKLSDPDALLLVFENGSGTPIGQVRFERVDAAELTAPIVVSWPETISFSIDVPFRGKGIAAGLIDEACRELRRKKGPVPIVAYIKPDNLASVRAFERAGFVRQDSPQADRLRLVKD